MRRLSLVILLCASLQAPAVLAIDDGGVSALAPQATATLARDRIVQISLGSEFSIARQSDGTLRAWGRNNAGVFRDSTTQRPVPSPLALGGRALASVHAGYAHACGLTAERQLVCWGNNRDGQLGAPFDPSLYNAAPMVVRLPSGSISSVSLGSAHSCALVEGRGVYCWGLNERGQATGAPSDDVAPTLVPNTSDVTRIAAGAQFTCARTSRGAVLCWGDNEAGQLGRAVRERDAAPALIRGLTDVRSVSAGYSHACAIGSDERLRCWGLDAWGAITTGDHTAPRAHFEPALVEGVRAVREAALGYGFTCALSDADPSRARVYCWGHAERGKTGVSWHHRRDSTPHEIALSSEPESIAACSDHACALLRDGSIECWGDGSHGELGDGRQLRSTQLVTVASLSGVTHIAASGDTTCASTMSAMYCWGTATRGQFAIDSPWGSAAPTLFRSRTHGGAISLSPTHACECPASGACSCAGDGLLSDATGYVASSVVAPHYAFARTLGRVRVRSVAGVTGAQCMALADGRVICVGEDRDHLIVGASSGARVVARLADTGLRGPQWLTASARRLCALDSRGTVRCAGDNGDQSISDASANVVPWSTVFSGVRAPRGSRRAGPLVATSRRRICAITSGVVRCRGGASSSTVTEITEFRDAEALYAGDDALCARRTNGQYFCWGLSDAFAPPFAAGPRSTPTEVSALRGAVELAMGANHLCARWSNGTVSCVGANDQSQLGDGTTSWSARPVRVRLTELNGSTAGP